MSYASINLPTPAVLEGTSPKPTLIIGSGPSTKGLVPYQDQIKEHFGNVIVINYSFKWFDNVADYHIVTEKTSKSSGNQVPVWLTEGDYRRDIPRIVHWKGIEQYPNRYNLHKCTRAAWDTGFSPTQYGKGFLTGPAGHLGFSLGSTTLCAMHLAAMLGSKHIYLVGADLLFRDEYDHWYPDSIYRKPPACQKPENQHEIVDVTLDGETYKTTAYFRDSAIVIDQYINRVFNDCVFYDFSNGLLRKPKQLNLKDFFECADPDCDSGDCLCA